MGRREPERGMAEHGKAGPARSACPVASALDLFGDKWTLVVIRDIVAGKKRYGEFEKSPEGIPTNILADRLRALEAHELIRKVPYQTKPTRYEYRLTEKGADLLPVLQAMARWGSRHIAGTWQPPAWFNEMTPDALKKPK
jgi:DNA-binding HxlR family transcriptional regulator